MSYAVKDGKDIVMFVDSEYVENQENVEKKEEKEEKEEKPEEKDQSAAYDPETGEINWDCPCLGGMAQGPCGEQFKAAFSCFVYSEAEPKGVDCVEKFKDMQDCFRQYPDVYGDEIDDDDEEEEASKAKEADAVPPTEDEKSEAVTVSSALEEGETSSLASWVSSWF